jgi:hypothetical protein
VIPHVVDERGAEAGEADVAFAANARCASCGKHLEREIYVSAEPPSASVRESFFRLDHLGRNIRIGVNPDSLP